MFKNIAKNRELVKRELEVYRKEELAKIHLEISEEYESGAKQKHDYEHTWHDNRATLEIEIAKLEATKESYLSHLEEKIKCYKDQYFAVISKLESQVQKQQETILGLIEKIPTQISQTTINNK